MAKIIWIDKLEETRSNKIEELKNECNKSILGRFSCDINGITYFFSCDAEAQSNFEKADRAFEKQRMTEVIWTAYDVDGNRVRLPLTQETFEPIYLAHLFHIQSNIAKLGDTLIPLITNEQDTTKIEAITWDEEIV